MFLGPEFLAGNLGHLWYSWRNLWREPNNGADLHAGAQTRSLKDIWMIRHFLLLWGLEREFDLRNHILCLRYVFSYGFSNTGLPFLFTSFATTPSTPKSFSELFSFLRTFPCCLSSLLQHGLCPVIQSCCIQQILILFNASFKFVSFI